MDEMIQHHITIKEYKNTNDYNNKPDPLLIGDSIFYIKG